VAGEITVNRAAMATAANQVEDALGQTRAQQTRLNGINDDLRSSWQGEASTAFGNAYARFSSDFQVVINALQGIQERLVGNRANYDASETANTQSVNRISAALNR
jgi:WXG100 family type VII secretion target